MTGGWDAVAAYALSLPDAVLDTYYGGPAVKANDRPIVTPSREPDSFCLHLPRDKVEMLLLVDPDVFWQTPHYRGWPTVLVRYAAADTELVRDQIAAARHWAMTQRRPGRRPA